MQSKLGAVIDKLKGIIQKIEDIFQKTKDGKLKAKHYLELWNKEETQITFQRAKKKLGKMIKAVLPRKWEVSGDVGFTNPATTGQMMGALGALYPVLGSHVRITPEFETEESVIEIQGKVKGHIRLGNLLYQVISLLLNKHCIRFIKLIFKELDSVKQNQEV